MPIATSLSRAASARMLPWDFPTSASIFAANYSIAGRRRGATVPVPAPSTP